MSSRTLMAALHSDIISMLMLAAIVDSPQTINGLNSTVISLSLVCKKWLHVTHSNPNLWATFSVVFEEEDTLEEFRRKARLVESHIKHSKSCGLYISLWAEDRYSPSADDPEFGLLCRSFLDALRLVGEHSSLWISFELNVPSWITSGIVTEELGTTVITRMERLRSLDVSLSIDDNGVEVPIYVPIIFDIASSGRLETMVMGDAFPILKSSQATFFYLVECAINSVNVASTGDVMDPVNLYNLLRKSPKLEVLEWTLSPGAEGDAVHWESMETQGEHVTLTRLKTLELHGATDHEIWKHLTAPDVSSLTVVHLARETTNNFNSFINFSERSFSSVTKLHLKYSELVYGDEGPFTMDSYNGLVPVLLGHLRQLKKLFFETDTIYLDFFSGLSNIRICPLLDEVQYTVLSVPSYRFEGTQSQLEDCIKNMAEKRIGTLKKLRISLPRCEKAKMEDLLADCIRRGMDVKCGSRKLQSPISDA